MASDSSDENSDCNEELAQNTATVSSTETDNHHNNHDSAGGQKKVEDDDSDYECSINPSEIPTIPENKFLFRPIAPRPKKEESEIEKEKQGGEQEEKQIEDVKNVKERSQSPEIDMSRYKDPEQTDEEKPPVPVDRKSQVLTTEAIRVSLAGRKMKGRGQFKFRPPPPQNDARPSYSDYNRRDHNRYHYRTRYRDDRHDDYDDRDHHESRRHKKHRR